jgi:AcrR family transcriptional regulator
LEALVECFWRRGYEATSLRDLTESMCLTAPSVYNAFGDKQELFSRALKRHLERTTRDRLRRLAQSDSPKAVLRHFFSEIIEQSINDRQRKGCLLVDSALEVAPHQAERCALPVRSKPLSRGASWRLRSTRWFIQHRRRRLGASATRREESDDRGSELPFFPMRTGALRD